MHESGSCTIPWGSSRDALCSARR